MAFQLSHWKNPRATIACKFRFNDIEYATHGAMQSLIALSHLDYKMADFKEMTILDYGCGTGRMARPLASVFKAVYAYDPVVECINAAKVECSHLQFPNLILTTDLSVVPEVDFAYSVSVIEHLTDPDASVMIQNLRKLVKNDSVLWYSISKNFNILKPWVTEDQVITNEKHLSAASRDKSIDIAKFNFRK